MSPKIQRNTPWGWEWWCAGFVKDENANTVWNWSGLCGYANAAWTCFSAVFPAHSLRDVLPSPWHFPLAPMSDPTRPSARAPAIRQHFNRVCAFAWKSLKLNASDGNLYASLCLRIYGRSCEGGNSKENGGVSPGYQGLSVPKLICVGLWERDKLCRQGIWPLLAIFGFFHFSPPPLRRHRRQQQQQQQRWLVINVANAQL